MSNFTIDDLRAEIEREYAPLRFQVGAEEFVLKSLLRTDKKVREAVIARLEALEAAHNGDDTVDEDAALASVRYVLESVTEGGRGYRLSEHLGDDLLLCMKLLEKWTEATQPGERKDSPNS